MLPFISRLQRKWQLEAQPCAILVSAILLHTLAVSLQPEYNATEAIGITKS